MGVGVGVEVGVATGDFEDVGVGDGVATGDGEDVGVGVGVDAGDSEAFGVGVVDEELTSILGLSGLIVRCIAGRNSDKMYLAVAYSTESQVRASHEPSEVLRAIISVFESCRCFKLTD